MYYENQSYNQGTCTPNTPGTANTSAPNTPGSANTSNYDDLPDYDNPWLRDVLEAERRRKQAEVRGDLPQEIQQLREFGVLEVKPANEWISEAATTPEPKKLWREFIFEGEVTCLFADSNTGKSILATQIATDIAVRGKKTIYLDFEMSPKQLERRYTDSDTGQHYRFPDNLMRAQIKLDPERGLDIERDVLPDLRDFALTTKCDMLIIDNLTWLTSTAEHAEAASLLMKELISIKREHNMTILVLAHTPKRPAGSKISQNDLAGSKQLMNFFDAAFAIGKSAQDESMRYIKQIKSRSSSIVYGEDNVYVCELIKENGFLHFSEVGYANEYEHLQESKSKDRAQQVRNVVSLASAGKSNREIAAELKIGKSSVQRILKAHYRDVS